MRRPEQRLWDRLRKVAANRVHMERVENLVGVGRPDVDTLVRGSFVPIELKYVQGWPSRAATSVLGDRGLSQVQKNWHLNWKNWGGTSIVVVGVDDETFAFNGATADHVNDYNTQQFRSAAMVIGTEEIVEMLIRLGERR